MAGIRSRTASYSTQLRLLVDVFVTTDRNIRYQQNLARRKIAVVILGKGRWRLIRKRLAAIAATVTAATPGSVVEIEIPLD